jgi:hypothetical protein
MKIVEVEVATPFIITLGARATLTVLHAYVKDIHEVSIEYTDDDIYPI